MHEADQFVIVNVKDGRILANKHHDTQGFYWADHDDCFILFWYDLHYANKVACGLEGAFVKPVVSEKLGKKDNEIIKDNELFRIYKKIDKMNIYED